MTVELLKKISKTESDDFEELNRLAKDLYENKKIEPSVYATLKANINRHNPKNIKTTITTQRTNRYSENEVLIVTKSFLDVYDGKKTSKEHVDLMKSQFGTNSYLYTSAKQHLKKFRETLDNGNPHIGQSMAANWADITLKLIQDRPEKMKNVIEACKAIYKETNNGNMYKVIQKWSISIKEC